MSFSSCFILGANIELNQHLNQEPLFVSSFFNSIPSFFSPDKYIIHFCQSSFYALRLLYPADQVPLVILSALNLNETQLQTQKKRKLGANAGETRQIKQRGRWRRMTRKRRSTNGNRYPSPVRGRKRVFSIRIKGDGFSWRLVTHQTHKSKSLSRRRANMSETLVCVRRERRAHSIRPAELSHNAICGPRTRSNHLFFFVHNCLLCRAAATQFKCLGAPACAQQYAS